MTIDEKIALFQLNRPVAIIGCGVMGSKVAWACARAGISTRIYDVSAAQIEDARESILSWSEGAERTIVENHLTVEKELGAALENVQLAFENVPENLDLKSRLLEQIGNILSPAAYMGSNASSLICTPLARSSGRPSHFFNMNFSDPRYQRLVEIMTVSDCPRETIIFAQEFARSIGMVPIVIKREIMGYSFNRLWRAIKKEVLFQVDQGYASAEDIDRAWMLVFGMSYGPFGMMDDIGLHSVAKVEEQYFNASGDESDSPPRILMEKIERGETGTRAGKGFYEYPDPAYKRPGFLDGKP